MHGNHGVEESDREKLMSIILTQEPLRETDLTALHLYEIQLVSNTTKYRDQHMNFLVVAVDFFEAKRLAEAEIALRWSDYWSYGQCNELGLVSQLERGALVI